ncbi:MAG: hypothetical protein FJY10_02565 [Bacteroidetes bacterium]|nr:hypothetical protein [Bacteroidota bacterium]
MKKLLTFIVAVIILSLIIPGTTEAKPFWIKLKLGVFANWSVSLGGGCSDGWGLCLVIGDNISPDYLGYDNETDKFTLKVAKHSQQAKHFSQGSYEIREDSPVDPKLIAQFRNFPHQGKTVVVRKGTYRITDDGEYYLMTVSYYLQ